MDIFAIDILIPINYGHRTAKTIKPGSRNTKLIASKDIEERKSIVQDLVVKVLSAEEV
jgi:hypothetical protein